MDRLSEGLPSVGDLTINCVYTALLQPVNVVKILIQVGYEPLPPTYRKPSLLFFSGGFYYPNIFKYMKYLADKEGSRLVLYRGLTPRLGGVFITNSVRSEVLAAIPPSTSKCPPEQIGVEVGRQCAATALAVITSHPLLVVTNRMIVSLIGGEEKYSTVTGAILTILSEEGLLGFYAGIIPHLLGEVSGKAIEVLIQEIVEKAQLNKKLGLPAPADGKTSLPVSAIHGFLSYPLQLTTTIMTVNNCGLAVSDLPAIQGTQSGWMSCIKALWSSGNIKRGSNLMFARKAPDQTWHTPPCPSSAQPGTVPAPVIVPDLPEASVVVPDSTVVVPDLPLIVEAPPVVKETEITEISEPEATEIHVTVAAEEVPDMPAEIPVEVPAETPAEIPSEEIAEVSEVSVEPEVAEIAETVEAPVIADTIEIVSEVPEIAPEVPEIVAEPVLEVVEVVPEVPPVVEELTEVPPVAVDEAPVLAEVPVPEEIPVVEAPVVEAPVIEAPVIEAPIAVVEEVAAPIAEAIVEDVVPVVSDCPDGKCELKPEASE